MMTIQEGTQHDMQKRVALLALENQQPTGCNWPYLLIEVAKVG